jgi:hypothetical protein
MPNGKPAGIPCIHLRPDGLCALFGKPERPDICVAFTATREFCGDTAEEAMQRLTRLERETRPDDMRSHDDSMEDNSSGQGITGST